MEPIVKGHAPLPVASEPQEKIPVALDFTSQFTAFSDETVRLVVEAVPKKPVPETPKAVELPYVSVSRPCESNDDVALPPK